MHLQERIIESDRAKEIYLTVLPRGAAPATEQAKEVFTAAADVLRADGARIFQERLFGSAEAIETAGPIRRAAYGDQADDVPPGCLLSPEGARGPLAGLQVHAIAGGDAMDVVRCGGGPRGSIASASPPSGRVLSLNGRRYVALTGLSGLPHRQGRLSADGPAEQAYRMFEMAEDSLRQVGGDMHAVARIWLWLGDILDWYDDLNRVRNRFFTERRLMGDGSANRLPASTGIGVRPHGPAVCALDAIAVIGDEAATEFHPAAGLQNSAYAYGSAFSRAATTAMPGGRTVFVSGTAAIDAAGATRHAGDPRAQIEMTLANVRAVLSDHGCNDRHVVSALAYCRTDEVQRLWRTEWSDLPWPCVTVISDICRADLEFEIELTACPDAR